MKRLLLLFISVVLMTNAYAQLVFSKSEAARWIENAVQPALFLSRQSFQVKDKKTGELYGLNNKDEFGTEISFGIKVKGGYVLTDKAIRPWEYNSKFDTYRNEYEPVPYTSEYADISESLNYDTLDIASVNVDELLSTSLYLVKSDCLSGDGLNIDYTKGIKNGWVVWACVETDDDLNKTAHLKKFCFTQQVEANGRDGINIDTPDDLQVLGGIYVIPVNKSIGTLEFCLSGIIVEKEGQWSIRFPFIGKQKLVEQTTAGNAAQDTEITGDDKLTPVDDVYQPVKTKGKGVKKNKKDKKDKQDNGE